MIEGSFYQAAQRLDSCGRNIITLNPDKFVYCQKEVEFAGFTMTPRKIMDIQSWFSSVILVPYAFSMAGNDIQRPPERENPLSIQVPNHSEQSGRCILMQPIRGQGTINAPPT